MEDIIVRSRYPRHNVQSRRKKKSTREDGKLVDTILRQLVISVIILVALGIVKSADTPVTNYLYEKISAAIFYNIDVESIYKGIDSAIAKVTNWKLPAKTSDDQTENEQLKKAVDDQTENVPTSADNAGRNTSDSNGGTAKAEISSAGQNEVESSSISNEGDISEAVNSQNGSSTKYGKYNFSVPVEGYLSSGYGYRIDPFTKTNKFHAGIDIEAEKDESIKSALDGEVLDEGSEATLGNYIKIKHSDGIETTYAHCSEILAKKGQKVKQGAIIAKVGNTGRSTGAHLHFEVSIDGKTVDPLKFIKVPVKT